MFILSYLATQQISSPLEYDNINVVALPQHIPLFSFLARVIIALFKTPMQLLHVQEAMLIVG